MKKLLILLTGIVTCSQDSLAQELKRPEGCDQHEKGERKNSALNVKSLKKLSHDFILKKLIEQTELNLSLQKEIGPVAINAILFPFLSRKDPLLYGLPSDLINNIFFDFIFNMIVASKTLTLAERSELIKIVLQEEKLQDLCKILKVEFYPLLTAQQKEWLSALNNLYFIPMLNNNPNFATEIININEGVGIKNMLLIDVLRMITGDKPWENNFSFEQSVYDFYLELIKNGVKVNVGIQRQQRNAPLYLYLLTNTQNAYKTIKLLIEGGLEINKISAGNNQITPLAAVILLASPRLLQHKRKFNESTDLMPVLDDIYNTINYLLRAGAIPNEQALNALAEVKKAILENNLIPLTKKEQLLQWQDKVTALIKSYDSKK